MSRSTKPVAVLREEGKSHYTKAELTQRQEAEEGLLSGIPLREEARVNKDPVAHEEFTRLTELLAQIGKNDDLYGASINRYCLLRSESLKLIAQKDSLEEKMEELEDREEDFEREWNLKDYFKLHNIIEASIARTDKAIKSDYRLMADIEKESLMTVAASLKATPKEKPASSNVKALKEALASGS